MEADNNSMERERIVKLPSNHHSRRWLCSGSVKEVTCVYAATCIFHGSM